MLFSFSNISKKESRLLDLLKILLLFQVMLGHSIGLVVPSFNDINAETLLDYSLLFYKLLFSFGALSAYIFIFLSGFFTSKIFLKDEKISFISVLQKRIVRIYPIFIFAIVVTLVLDYIGVLLFNYDLYLRNGMNYNVVDHYTLNIFILNLLSLQPTLTETIGSNGPLWTLGYLVQFFVLGVIIKILFYKNLHFLILNVVLLVVVSFYNLEFSLLYFVWLSGTYSRTLQLNIQSKPLINLVIISTLLLLMILTKVVSSYFIILMTPIFSIILLYIIKIFPNQIYKLNFESLKRIKDTSYGLYTLHMPILFFFLGMYNEVVNNNFSFITYLFFTSISISLTYYISIKLEQILNKKGL